MTKQEFEKIAMEESFLMCVEAATELHDEMITLAHETFEGKKVGKVEEDNIDDTIRKIIGK